MKESWTKNTNKAASENTENPWGKKIVKEMKKDR